MLRNVQLSGYQVPTPIQAYVLPAIFQGKDVIGVATTGNCTVSSRCYSPTDNTRLREDCCLPYPNSIQIDGESKEISCASSDLLGRPAF